MEYYELDDFLKISAVLNYQLSAKQINWSNIATIILEEKTLTPSDEAVLLHVFDYVGKVYGTAKRDLGPLSVLHPLRATALLSQASPQIDLMDVMTCLLHDYFEDFKPEKFQDPNWMEQDQELQALLSKIPENRRGCLVEHLQWLTKKHADTYNHYIGQLLDQACNTPEVVRVKLADRLDNTYDMRIDLQDPLQGKDFFEVIFQILFTNTYKGYTPERLHQTTYILNGAERLYQLFKNIVLMSLIRLRRAAAADPISQTLFKALAMVSIKEAQRITLHIFGYHETSVASVREILNETFAYAQSGGLDKVTLPRKESPMDGLFISVFDQPKRMERKKQLAALYQNKPLMIETAVSFLIIFLNFLNDADYYVHGISADGIKPEMT